MSKKENHLKQDSVFLVTGGAGFIGSNLCETLIINGYRVRCLDNLSNGKIKNIENLISNPKFEFIEGDIRNINDCLKSCENVDYVLHQAAMGSVPRSILFPILYEEVNVKGMLNMLEASKINKVKKFIYASSSSVYGDDSNLPKIEGKEGNILSPYALTKKINEEYAKMYTRLYGLETYGLRYFNVFGPKQNPNGEYAAVIPKFIMNLMNNKSCEIFGDGRQSRDFTYVANVIEANIKACSANSKYAGHVFNIACGDRIFLIDIYKYISGVLKKDLDPVFLPSRKGDILHSNADISKAKEMLDYNPSWSFEMGIKAVINWYLENL